MKPRHREHPGDELAPAWEPRRLFSHVAATRASAGVTLTLASILLLSLLIGTLGAYWLHYFPYEDDFSLLRYSAVENSPVPSDWIRLGYKDYFTNDWHCPLNRWNFVRPLTNLTYYVESLLGGPPERLRLMVTNFLCWLGATIVVFCIAFRLGASAWAAALAMTLFGLSPCCYRLLIHSNARTNGIATVFVLMASWILLHPRGLQSNWRPALAGVMVALGTCGHEQALTSIPVLAVSILWLNRCAQIRLAPARLLVVLTLFALPSLALVLFFYWMNPSYGSNYAVQEFIDLWQHAPLSVGGDALSGSAGEIPIVGRMGARILPVFFLALTPIGFDNSAHVWNGLGIAVFLLATGAVVGTWKSHPRQAMAFLSVILFAAILVVSGVPLEPRFTMLEIAWGSVAVASASSCARWRDQKWAFVSGIAAASGMMLFNILSFEASIIQRRPMLTSRCEADREAFSRLRTVIARYPNANLILVNEQTGTWSARAMIELAGGGHLPFEILPTISDSGSADFRRDLSGCPASTNIRPMGPNLEIRLSFGQGCGSVTFGRDMACTESLLLEQGRPLAAAWARRSFITYSHDAAKSPVIHEVHPLPGRPTVVMNWTTRLSVPDVTVVSP